MYLKIINKFQSICWSAANKLFNRRYQRRIQEHNFTIICYNCIGGIIYNRLNYQFLSPTINLFESQEDFWKLVENLPHYMQQEISFVESNRPYPVAQLDDITLFCNHYKTSDEFLSCWNRRKSRINWDKMFLIIYDSPLVTEKRLSNLLNLGFKKYIILTSNPVHANDTRYKYIKPSNKGRPDEAVFLDTDFFGLRTFEKQWDFVKWLNS